MENFMFYPDQSRGVKYWRNPTKQENAWGQGCIHYAWFKLSEVTKPDGTIKKWVKFEGLRYNRV